MYTIFFHLIICTVLPDIEGDWQNVGESRHTQNYTYRITIGQGQVLPRQMQRALNKHLHALSVGIPSSNMAQQVLYYCDSFAYQQQAVNTKLCHLYGLRMGKFVTFFQQWDTPGFFTRNCIEE